MGQHGICHLPAPSYWTAQWALQRGARICPRWGVLYYREAANMAEEGTIIGGDGHNWEQQSDLLALFILTRQTSLDHVPQYSPINHTRGWPVLAGGNNSPSLSNTAFSAEFPLPRAKISSHKALCKYEETWAISRNLEILAFGCCFNAGFNSSAVRVNWQYWQKSLDYCTHSLSNPWKILFIS